MTHMPTTQQPEGGTPVLGLTFQYTVTGSEPNKSELVIALPEAQLDSGYAVLVSQEQATYQLTMSVATSSKTTTQFVLTLSADATAGDVFSFTILDL